MFYVAYFKKDVPAESRPVTFIYNGGPGSSTMWLHMGAFGPRRIVTADDQHTSPAPYELVDNAYSLLDVSDLVFIDAPGTGFGRLFGKDKEKAFWGVDPDGHAFARFIARFLSTYQRWNSPKYLFGESYGTTRSAVLAGILETESHIDLNGVILLSQILNFDDSADAPQWNPGIDVPYELALPTFAATAYYHKRLPTQPAALEPFLAEVEQFAMGDYASALAQGSQLPEATRQAIAEKLHQYTGLPVAYILKADLRVNVGQFNHNLQGSEDLTTGRLDSRFSGPTIDPLAEEAAYDPQAAAISSAYVAAFNDYTRQPAQIRRWPHLPAGVGCRQQRLGVQAQGPRRAGRLLGRQRDAGSCHRDEVQPASQGHAERRLFRSCHAVLRCPVRNVSPADPGQPEAEHRILLVSIRAHGVPRTKTRSSSSTTRLPPLSPAPTNRSSEL